MSALRAAAISPLVICVAAPFYAAWLYYQTTAALPTSPISFAIVTRIASTWTVLFLPLAYILVFTYGQLFLRLATAKGWSGALHYAVAGAAPSLLTLALPFSWQEAFVPAALFGGLTGLAFWRLNRPKGSRP
jgi:hypothetical protein